MNRRHRDTERNGREDDSLRDAETQRTNERRTINRKHRDIEDDERTEKLQGSSDFVAAEPPLAGVLTSDLRAEAVPSRGLKSPAGGASRHRRSPPTRAG